MDIAELTRSSRERTPRAGDKAESIPSEPRRVLSKWAPPSYLSATTTHRLRGGPSLSSLNPCSEWRKDMSVECRGHRRLSAGADNAKISEKLEPADRMSTKGRCAICQSPLDTDVSKASALGAAEMSRRLSQNSNALQMQRCEGFTKRNNESDDCCVQGSVDFRKAFCYGCQLMTKELLSVPQMVKGCIKQDLHSTLSVEMLLKAHC